MKIENFVEGVTVMFPRTKDGMEVFVEGKPFEKKTDWEKKYPSNPNDFDLIHVVMNIAFYVMENNNKRYVKDLKPEAVIRIRYNDKVVKKADKKKKKEKDLKFGWWDGSKWVYEDKDKTKKSKHNFENKDWLGYGDLETKSWPKDPPVGWGC